MIAFWGNSISNLYDWTYISDKSAIIPFWSDSKLIVVLSCISEKRSSLSSQQMFRDISLRQRDYRGSPTEHRVKFVIVVPEVRLIAMHRARGA